VVADSANAHVRAWGDNDVIVYWFRNALWQASAAGGKSVPLTERDSAGTSRLWPDILPGGRAALITLFRASLDAATIGIVTIPDGKVTDLNIRGFYPRYVNSGFIVFARENGSIMAAPFSLRSLRVTGEAEAVLDNVVVKGYGATELAVSRNGLIAYRLGSAVSGGNQFFRVTPAGAAARLSNVSGNLMTPRVSPDGRRIAVRVGASSDLGTINDIYTLDLPTQTFSRLTNGQWNVVPVWSHDGKRILFASAPAGQINDAILKWQLWDGSGPAETFLDTVAHAISLGPPGTFIVTRTPEQQDLLIAPYNSPRQLTPLIVHPTRQRGIRISPDGRLLAYSSEESGVFEVYVRPIPGPGPRLQVSADGGEEPVWSKDGTRLFYRTDTHMMSATIARTPELSLVRRDTLFADPYARHGWDADYDLLPNGDFLMIGRDFGTGTNIFAIANFDVLLRERFRKQQ
jgi:serine/threonine-protein kinase